jgi:hypothetical protein
VPGILDVAGPRADGRLVAAVGGELRLVSPTGRVTRFAPDYSVGGGPEAYIALSPGQHVRGAACQFTRDDVFALDLSGAQPGVTRISAKGVVSHLATVAGVSTLGGIAFDTVGRFDHRLLVIGPAGSGRTQVSAVDCRGGVESVGTVDTALEGGITVAPPSFGSFGGQLIAPNEGDGSIYAVSSTGQLSTVVATGVPAGGDIGVESLGFVPRRRVTAYLADRGTPPSGAPHPGTDHMLRLRHSALSAHGVRPGDLLAATEGAATALTIRCAQRCSVAVLATGPASAHGEGHVVVTTG